MKGYSEDMWRTAGLWNTLKWLALRERLNEARIRHELVVWFHEG